MARSVYKLEAIEERAHMLRGGAKVVDLGCFPGSWSQLALERIGPKGRLVGVDLKAPEVIGAHWIPRSIYEVQSGELIEALGGLADVVLSDMAPNTTGTRDGDHYAQADLARRALEVARMVLRPGGGFICKIFEGEEASGLQAAANLAFKRVKRMRPDAVRKESREWFLVCWDLKSSAQLVPEAVPVAPEEPPAPAPGPTRQDRSEAEESGKRRAPVFDVDEW